MAELDAPEPDPSTARPKRLPPWAKVIIGGLIPLVVSLSVLAQLRPRTVTVCVFPRPTKAKADILAISDAVARYAIEHQGRFPESLETLIAPDPDGSRYLDVDTVPLDPWGRPYGYEPPPEGSPKFRVFSLGPDGRPGGEGEARDIDNLLIKEGKI